MCYRFSATMGIVLSAFAVICYDAASSTADIVTFQQGVGSYSGTKDLHIRQDDKYSSQDHNTGGTIYLVTGQYADGNDNDNVRMLIDFDGLDSYAASLPASNQQIESAKMKLYLAGTAGVASSTAQTLDIFKNLTAFNEGTGNSGDGRDGALAQTGESCFREKAKSQAYWAGGGEHSSSDWGSALDTGIALTGSNVGSWVEFDVTGAFAANGSDLATQNGFLIMARVDNGNPYQDNTQGGKQFLFSSRNAGSNAPILEITTSTVPEPTSISMVMVSLMGLLAYAWRKRKQVG